MFNLREYREPTHRLPDLLPWAGLVAPGVVLQKDAVLQKTYAYRGKDPANLSPAERATIAIRQQDALKRLAAGDAASGWAIFIESQRHEADDYPASRFQNLPAALIEDERRKFYSGPGRRFDSTYLITFVWRMPVQASKQFEALLWEEPKGATRDDRRDNQRDLETFQKKVAEVVDLLRDTVEAILPLSDEETLTYLKSTISTNRHPVAMPEVPFYLDGLLPDMAFTPGDVPMLGDCYIPTATITGFPSGETTPMLLHALDQLDIPYRWVTRFICLSKPEAEKELGDYRRAWWQGRKKAGHLLKEASGQGSGTLLDTSAEANSNDANHALEELKSDAVAYGYYTSTITVWDRSLETARHRMRLVKQVIQSRGLVVRDELLNARDAWLGSHPGNLTANVRRPLLSTGNLTCLSPLSAPWLGDQENQHLKGLTGVGTAHVYCSSGSSPFRLNVNLDDLGHTLMVGAPGSGKSTALALFCLMWTKYPGARVVIFDKGRSLYAATLAVGGVAYEPGNPHSPMAWQPLAAIDDPSERIWAAGFVETMLVAQGVLPTPEQREGIGATLDSLADRPPRERTLTMLATILGGRDRQLSEALRPYTLEGEFGQFFDGSEDGLRTADWMMVEMQHLMNLGDRAVVPALEYLFRRIEKRVRESGDCPTLLVLDEVWLFLSHPVFAAKLREWLKVMRKHHVYVVFATQDVADLMTKDPALRETVLKACQTKIFLADPDALTPAGKRAYREFGLSDEEREAIAQARRKRDYYFRSPKGRRFFQLDLGPVALAFAGVSSNSDQPFLDEVAALPSALERTLALLEYRGLHEKVAELKQVLEERKRPIPSKNPRNAA